VAGLRGIRSIGALFCVAIAAGACGPGADKKEAADAIAAAGKRHELRIGDLTLVSTARTLTRSLPLRPQGPTVPAHADLVLDVTHNRAALLAPAAAAARIGVTTSNGGPPALILFAGPVTYVRRPTQGIAGARPWYRFDSRTLGDLTTPSLEALAAPRTIGDLVVISPLVLLEQTSGVLTGSLKHLRSEPVRVSGAIAGAEHYRANASIEKVTREFRRDADATRATKRLLRVFGAGSEINTAEAWLYPDGRLGRLALTYPARPDKNNRFDVRFDLRLAPPASAARAATEVLVTPQKKDVVEVATLSQLRNVVAQWFEPAKAGLS
jgi:hypothetical protein